MTYQEALKQALLECGLDERTVARRMKHASIVFPIPKEFRDSQIEEGKERQVIESVKEIGLLVRSNKALFAPMIQEEMKRTQATN